MVSAIAKDRWGVASVLFQVDGRQIGTPVTASPYSGLAEHDTAQQRLAHADGGGNRSSRPPSSGFSPGDGEQLKGQHTDGDDHLADIWGDGFGHCPGYANATDSGGVASVAFQADGKQIGLPVTATPYAVSLNTHAAEQGSARADSGGDRSGRQECSGYGPRDGQ